jgi:hypothetical protein
MTINLTASLLDLIGTIISSLTLLIVVWATLTAQREFRISQKNLSSYSGSEIFNSTLEISKLLISKDTFTDKLKVFKALYANTEDLKKLKRKKLKNDDIELNAFILLNISLYEYTFGAHKYSVLKSMEWEGWVNHMKFFFSRKKVLDVWKDFKFAFQDDFIDWIDKNVIEKSE